jgi:hypothetical protein
MYPDSYKTTAASLTLAYRELIPLTIQASATDRVNVRSANVEYTPRPDSHFARFEA